MASTLTPQIEGETIAFQPISFAASAKTSPKCFNLSMMGQDRIGRFPLQHQYGGPASQGSSIFSAAQTQLICQRQHLLSSNCLIFYSCMCYFLHISHTWITYNSCHIQDLLTVLSPSLSLCDKVCSTKLCILQ